MHSIHIAPLDAKITLRHAPAVWAIFMDFYHSRALNLVFIDSLLLITSGNTLYHA